MKTILSLCAVLLGFVIPTSAMASEDCASGAPLDTGILLHSNISDHIKYSIHCIVARKDGAIAIVMLGADSPVGITARKGGRVVGTNFESQGGQKVPVSREIVIDVKLGDRIDLRVDPLTRSSERQGHYRLLASHAQLDDPQLFSISKVFDLDTTKPRYTDPQAILQTISLGKSKMASFYFPNVGAQPNLRFAVVGLDPAKVMVSTIQLSNGQQQTVVAQNGYFHIPAVDSEGMILTLGNKSPGPIQFKLDFKL